MPVSLGQIQALALLLGGVDAASEATGIDEDTYNEAFNDELYKHPDRERNRIEARITVGFENYFNEHPDEVDLIERAGFIFGGFQLTNEQEEKVFDSVINKGTDFETAVSGLETLNALPLTQKQSNAIFNGVFERNADFADMLKIIEEEGMNINEKDSRFWKWFAENCTPT
jgi:hypothetical protein